MEATAEAKPSFASTRSTGLVAGLVNTVVAFAVVTVLWYLCLHPNGVLALYTPMYGFSLVVVLVASIVLIGRLMDDFPVPRQGLHPAARGLLLTAMALLLTAVLVYGFFWQFIGRLGITYFSPHAIVAAGGVGAEIFNARENASTAIIYLFTAFLWIALWWAVGFVDWPWRRDDRGPRALARVAVVSVLATIAYVVLFHPHVSYLFYPAQTMAGVEPWWMAWAQTSSAFYNLGLLLCAVLWLVVSDVLWDGYPWRLLDQDGRGGPGRGLFALVGSAALGLVTFVIMLRLMEMVWYEPFEGGQYTDAPYFRYLHAGEMAGFAILAAFVVATYFGEVLSAAGWWARALARTLATAVLAVLLYEFYYSPLSTLLLGKVPGVGQPEDTSLVWTLLFVAVVLIQGQFFRGWPLRTGTKGADR